MGAVPPVPGHCPTRKIAPFPGVPEVCAWVTAHGGLNLVATHRARPLTEALLRYHGLAPLFSDVVTIFDGFPRKPDPAMLLALLDRHRLPPDDTLAVGDREIDLQAGEAAGLTTCLFRGDETLTPGIRIQHYSQLLDLLSLMYTLMS